MSLADMRKEKGFTQAEVACELGVTQSCVAMWETGKSVPTPNKLMHLGKLLGVGMDEIYRSLSKNADEVHDTCTQMRRARNEQRPD